MRYGEESTDRLSNTHVRCSDLQRFMYPRMCVCMCACVCSHFRDTKIKSHSHIRETHLQSGDKKRVPVR